MRLAEGLLVAAGDLIGASRLYDLYRLGSLLPPMTWYLTLLLMSFPFAILYRRFSDNPSLALLAAALSLWATGVFLAIVLPGLRMGFIHVTYLGTKCFLLLATANHCLATIRLGTEEKRRRIVGRLALGLTVLAASLLALVPWIIHISS